MTAPPAAEPLLAVDELYTWLDTPRGVVRAVDGVSLSLAAGSTLGVVGESGSGKTILGRSIMNLLPRRLVRRSAGDVRLDGRPVRALGVHDMRRLWGREMAIVPQDPLTSLNPVMTVGRQLDESLRRNRDLPRRARAEATVELLRSVGLTAPERRLGEYPHQLSGGMRQRVCIAIALAGGPRMLIADEPTTALDVTIQRQILDLLQRQQTERRMAMMLITHDLGVVANRTDEVVVMYAGQVVERAPTRTIFERPSHPYTHGLLSSIPRLDAPRHIPLRAIPGRPPDLTAPLAGCRFAPRCLRVQQRCRVERPPLEPREGGTLGQEVRCFFPMEQLVAQADSPLTAREGM